MSKTWLITGSARGLGRAITTASLAAGHNVVAAARDPARLADLQQQYGRMLQPFALDVTDAQAAQAAVDFALASFGGLDVLVNNAGYGHARPFEQTGAASFRDQIETNLFGVVNLTRAALPVMRQQRAGHIINISSVGGRVGTPGLSAYQTAKWAVGGFTEVLAQEVAHFGVKVIAVEPGGMRTDWGTTARGGAEDIALLPDYEPSVGAMAQLLKTYVGHEISDPARVAQVIVDLAERNDLPVHLLLGSDALMVFGRAEARRQKDAADWEAVSRSTDFPGTDLSLLVAAVKG